MCTYLNTWFNITLENSRFTRSQNFLGLVRSSHLGHDHGHGHDNFIPTVYCSPVYQKAMSNDQKVKRNETSCIQSSPCAQDERTDASQWTKFPCIAHMCINHVHGSSSHLHITVQSPETLAVMYLRRGLHIYRDRDRDRDIVENKPTCLCFSGCSTMLSRVLFTFSTARFCFLLYTASFDSLYLLVITFVFKIKYSSLPRME